MRSIGLMAAVLAAGVLGGGAMAAAGGMHPVLGAKLAGMGEHGVVNLQSDAAKGQLCWTFDVPTKGVTGASVRDSAGMVVAKLGASYRVKGCASVPKKRASRNAVSALIPRFPRTISLIRAGVTPSAFANALEDKPIGFINSSSRISPG